MLCIRIWNILIRSEMSNVKVTAGNDQKTLRHNISQPNEGNFTQF